ncbi:hypothetical protein [Prochlorothrix hollandica]|uniref:hypothetical protein n=2 Tax=Prochlorothrix hollandica TaxID=1223 RepID=UPI0008A51E09|nr:hypothetical protein [Prochlorothrix hollandica]
MMIPSPPAPLLSFFAWSLVLGLAWHWALGLRSLWQQSRRLHQIPCSQCRFLVNSPYLKCSVNPAAALSEQAIGCRDYEPSPWG